MLRALLSASSVAATATKTAAVSRARAGNSSAGDKLRDIFIYSAGHEEHTPSTT
jgi:hypothetical protein